MSRKPPRGKRNKRYQPRPLVVPQMIQGYDVVASVREAVRVVRAQFAGSTDTLSRQNLADLNMVFQQVTKVHEKAGRREPARAEIMAAQNVLARLNADGAITLREFEQVVDVLERVVAAVRNVADKSVWQDVELTLSVKQELHGSTEELWFGGALLPERKAA